MTCPVVKAISEIRGAGLFIDDDTSSIIKLGGNQSNCEIVFDDMLFYMNSRKLELARFELSKPSMSDCETKAKKFYGGITYSELYSKLIDTVFKKKYMYEQFVRLVDLISDMEKLIEKKVEYISGMGKPLNITIPDIILLPHIDKLIIYRPDVLNNTTNKIIDYVNKININTIIDNPVRINVKPVDKFVMRDMNTEIPNITGRNPDEILKSMHQSLEHELNVCKYLHEIEKYQCNVINRLNDVFDVCNRLVSELTKK